MASKDITPLHVRSGYSLLRGTASLEALIDRARTLGHKQLALTDVNNLCAATSFYNLTTQADIRPIIGAELHHNNRSLIALVQSDKGYQNLCRAITAIHGNEDFDLPNCLAPLSDGLQLITESPSLAVSLLEAGIDPKRLWLALEPDTQSYTRINRLVKCSEKLDLPLVATGKSLFTGSEDYDTARLLTSIRLGSTYQNVKADQLPHRSAYLKSPQQLHKELAHFPQAIRNNQRLAEKCHYKLLPRKFVFPNFPCPSGLSPPQFLRQLCRRGISWRYTKPPSGLNARLEKELRIIERLGFSEYFLVVWDIVQYAYRHGAPVAGRGSGASSLVAYLLGITNVCPLQFNIPFERFLNEARKDCPDLDIDFCWRIRDEVIDYAFDRWGSDRVAMVCTHNTFQPSSALRETAKAHGLSDQQISNFRPSDWIKDKQLASIRRLSRRIVGLPHNLSVHPGGIVIGRMPIDHYVPVQFAPKGVRITQYDKRGVEDIGLVKLDLLGNRGLSTIRQASDLIRQHTQNKISIESLPLADPATIRLLQNADTVGCNQLESPAMRHLLKAIQPKNILDVAQALALIRPGAAGVGMKNVFIRRHRHLELVPQQNPAVDRVLCATNGVMLYEDDVMLVLSALLDIDLPQADQLRKAIQKCRTDHDRLTLSENFLNSCRARKVNLEYAKSLWVQMAKFNEFSFCRAHAASYAMLAYTGAYLKTHFPLHFWVSALNNNQSMYHPRVYVAHATRAGIRFLLPDVNLSSDEFTIQGRAVRVGLDFVSDLGPTSVDTILQTRGRQPYQDLSDFLRRTRLDHNKTRSLILCGAFDSFSRTRPALMMELQLWFASRHDSAADQQVLLSAQPNIPTALGDYSPQRKYDDEWQILGITTRQHIMAQYRPGLARSVDIDSRHLTQSIGRRVRIAGVLEAHRTARTSNGTTMQFLTMDDEFGLFEVTLFPNTIRAAQRILGGYGPYIIIGRTDQQYGTITVSAQSISLAKPSAQRIAS